MGTTAIMPSLSSIIRESQNASLYFPPPSHSHRSATLTVSLPDPPSLYPFLVTIGAEEMVAKEMDRVCNARALELRSCYESSINNALGSLVNLPRDAEKRILDTFVRFYLAKVKSWIQDGVAAYESVRKQANQAVGNVEAPKSANLRRTFNTVHPPLFCCTKAYSSQFRFLFPFLNTSLTKIHFLPKQTRFFLRRSPA